MKKNKWFEKTKTEALDYYNEEGKTIFQISEVNDKDLGQFLTYTNAEHLTNAELLKLIGILEQQKHNILRYIEANDGL